MKNTIHLVSFLFAIMKIWKGDEVKEDINEQKMTSSPMVKCDLYN